MSGTDSGVAFVVPIYNKAPWLPAVLAGLAAQRGDFAREYVFVDDGSTDGSLDVVRKRTRDWPATTIVAQANAGSAAATNAGIARANLPFVKFCDADDVLLPDATRLLLAALQANPAACLAWGERIWYGAPDELRPESVAVPADPAVATIAAPLKPAMQNSLFNPSQFLARTADLKAVGGCDERVVFSQEYTLTLRLATRGAFLRLAAPVAYVLRDAPGRLSGNAGRQLQRVTQALAWFLRDHPDLPPELVRFACRRAAGRAWKWRRRQFAESYWSPWFARHLRARLPGPNPTDPVAFIEACAGAFAAAGIALPGAPAAERQT